MLTSPALSEQNATLVIANIEVVSIETATAATNIKKVKNSNIFLILADGKNLFPVTAVLKLCLRTEF
jgi:hypothetical protein